MRNVISQTTQRLQCNKALLLLRLNIESIICIILMQITSQEDSYMYMTVVYVVCTCRENGRGRNYMQSIENSVVNTRNENLLRL